MTVVLPMLPTLCTVPTSLCDLFLHNLILLFKNHSRIHGMKCQWIQSTLYMDGSFTFLHPCTMKGKAR